jgi:hypothetical protein
VVIVRITGIWDDTSTIFPLLSFRIEVKPPNFPAKITSVVYQKFLEIDVSSTSRLRGVFSESRKSCLIPSNGSLVLKFYPAQPQKMAVCAKVAFSACTKPLITALGAFDKLLRICVAVF